MDNSKNTNEQQWRLLVLLLKELAEQKLGIGYQTRISEITNWKVSNVSRFFSLKYTPRLDSFLIIAKAIKVNFFFEDQENLTDLNMAFERAMESLGRRPDKLPKN